MAVHSHFTTGLFCLVYVFLGINVNIHKRDNVCCNRTVVIGRKNQCHTIDYKPKKKSVQLFVSGLIFDDTVLKNAYAQDVSVIHGQTDSSLCELYILVIHKKYKCSVICDC